MLASKAFAILALFAAVGTLASPVPTESKSSDVSTDGLDDLDEVPVPGGQLSDSLSLDDPTVSLKTQKYSTSQSGTIDYKLKMASYGTGGYIGACNHIVKDKLRQASIPASILQAGTPYSKCGKVLVFKYGKDEHRIRIRDSTQDDSLVLVSQQVWHDLTNSWDGGVISPFQWSISDK